ncbi:hypothetical protein [Streptomyces boninensis]|uniref:hypothetical protein n=1 Tax=Streptomyces boninensis TaxID=2039455 RepID=UPI003B2197E4
MQTIYVPCGAHQEVRRLLERAGAVATGLVARWEVPAEVAPAVSAQLTRRGITFHTVAESAPDSEFAAAQLPGYLGLEESTGKPAPAEVPELLEPPKGTAPLANQRLIDLISPLTPGLTWSPPHDGLRSLADAPRLSDPVRIADVFGKDQGTTGMWLIDHDGFEYLSAANLAVLREAGAAWSHDYQFGEEVYPVLPTVIFNGNVIDLLLEHQVRFAAPPLYLLPLPETAVG